MPSVALIDLMCIRPLSHVVRPLLGVIGPFIVHTAVDWKLIALTESFHRFNRIYLRHTAILSLILFLLSDWLMIHEAVARLSLLHLHELVLIAF